MGNSDFSINNSLSFQALNKVKGDLPLEGVRNIKNELEEDTLGLSTKKQKPQPSFRGLIQKAALAFKGSDEQAVAMNEFKELLWGLKGADGKQRFGSDAIGVILNAANEKNIKYAEQFLEYTDHKGRPMLYEHDVAGFMKIADEDNIGLIVQLLDLKDVDGRDRLQPYTILKIAKATNKENAEFVQYLLKSQSASGEFRWGVYIAELAEVATKDNIDFMKQLSELKDKDGEYRVCYSDIIKYAQIATELSPEIIEQLSETYNATLSL
ncbi:hypothetical protein tpqmel_0315 [Candidatus Gastranaerophilus sp. (ex Termes propinquus)]|nr:hypothetical protein tpqmel_0315 [Candidatus Gastranaerophilus sp. (ex Termes propinquus)]